MSVQWEHGCAKHWHPLKSSGAQVDHLHYNCKCTENHQNAPKKTYNLPNIFKTKTQTWNT